MWWVLSCHHSSFLQELDRSLEGREKIPGTCLVFLEARHCGKMIYLSPRHGWTIGNTAILLATCRFYRPYEDSCCCILAPDCGPNSWERLSFHSSKIALWLENRDDKRQLILGDASVEFRETISFTGNPVSHLRLSLDWYGHVCRVCKQLCVFRAGGLHKVSTSLDRGFQIVGKEPCLQLFFCMHIGWIERCIWQGWNV